jgi:hypothetical protein
VGLGPAEPLTDSLASRSFPDHFEVVFPHVTAEMLEKSTARWQFVHSFPNVATPARAGQRSSNAPPYIGARRRF